MNYDDIIDGLQIIARRRGLMVQQGDVLILEAAIKALLGRPEFCSVCRPRKICDAAEQNIKESK